MAGKLLQQLALEHTAQEIQLRSAVADFNAIRLRRRREAALAKSRVLELCHPLQLR
jgi:hypothetical protein